MSIFNCRAFAGALAMSALLVFGESAFAKDFKLGDLEIIQPWSRATPSSAKAAGGWLVIKNGGETPDRLVSATAEIADRAAVHEMTMSGGVMSMRALKDGLAIPARSEVVLKPGSYHLMFEDLKRPLKQGESFSGTLTFEKAGTVSVTYSVEGMGATAPAHEGQSHGDMH